MSKPINKTKKCLECKARTTGIVNYFCSVECACYSGCFNITAGMNEDKLKIYLKEKLKWSDIKAIQQVT